MFKFKYIVTFLYIFLFSISLLFFGYSLFKVFHNLTNIFFILYLTISILNLIILLYLLKVSNKLRSVLLFSYLGISFCVYGFEIYLTYKLEPDTIFEIYEKYKNENLNFFPHSRQRVFTTSNNSGFKNEVFTLGGISKTNLIMTNENGFYPISRHDEYGWANIDPDYDNFDIALIGDSYVEGYSVNQKNTIVEYLKSRNYNAISFAFAGNNPLHMYATYVEYVEIFQPKKIFWFHTDNHLHELELDKENKYLMRYMINNNFNQNLIQRQNEIDNLMKNHSLKMWKERKKTRSRKNNYLRMLKLGEIRENLGLFYRKKEVENKNCFKNKYNFNVSNETIQLYNKILSNLKERTNKINAKIYFVYLPSKLVFSECSLIKENRVAVNADNLNKIKKQIISNDIIFLDIKNKIENEINDYEQIYSTHFNSKGYAFVSDKIIDLLSE